MEIEFDPAKDAANLAKHGVSLADARRMDVQAFAPDERVDYGEPRLRAYGLLDGATCCMVFTYRGPVVRVIGLRRVHLKEYRRNVP